MHAPATKQGLALHRRLPADALAAVVLLGAWLFFAYAAMLVGCKVARPPEHGPVRAGPLADSPHRRIAPSPGRETPGALRTA
jgi:hypothetical protein